MNVVKRFFSLFTLLFLCDAAAEHCYPKEESPPQCIEPCFAPSINSSFFLSADQHFGSSIISDSSYTRIGLSSLPDLSKCPIGVLAEGNVYLFESDKWALSVGGGLRFLNATCQSIWGVNLFWTQREVKEGYLNQMIAGFEWITPCYEVYLNGYFPYSGTKLGEPIVYEYDSPYSVVARREEFLFQGFDLSIGKYWYTSCNSAFYTRAGTYYLENSRTDSWGALFQLEAWWNSYLYAGALLTRDNVFETSFEGYVGLMIPFEHIICFVSWYHPCKEGCDGWLKGRCGRSARVRQIGQAGIKQTCCIYEPQNYDGGP